MAYSRKFSENGQDDNSRSSGDSSDPLPSHGLSELVGTAGACSDFLKRITDGKGLEPCSELPGPAFSSASVKGESSCTNYDDLIRKRSASSVAMETGSEPTAGTSTQGQFYAPFQFPAGGTEPLNGSTVDVTQLGMLVPNDDVLYEEQEITCEMIEPKLKITTSEYTRFRYLSEKNKTNKKTRQYETDEDRRTLAEISVENYTGQAKVIAYCTHQNGDLHPYSLYGDDCEDGVYVKQINFGLRSPNLKLSKVSITTPVAKEYEHNVAKQRNFLEKTLGSEKIDEKLHTESAVSDKQVVRLMFKVILKDGSNITLTHLSDTIHNKKEGKEFRIDTIEPASAPAAGSQSTNVDKNRVLVVVTEDTAFPKDVGVVLRKEFGNGQQWEECLEKDQICVIKKAVVKFIPPPYLDKHVTEDVEVELRLYDVKTKKETEPVRFLYTGIDEYGVMVKGKKRKLDENLAYLQHIGRSASAGGSSQAQRKTLQAVRTKTQTSSGSSSDSSSAENSLTMNQTGYAENRVISLEQTRGSSTSLPFTTYSQLSPQQSYATQGQQNQEYSLEEQAVFTLEGQQAAQQYQPAVSHNGQNLGAIQNIAVVTSASSVFSSAPVTEQSSSEYSPITTFSSGLSMYASLQGQQQQSQQQQQQDDQQQQLVHVKKEERQQLQKQLLQQLQNQQQLDEQANIQTLMEGLQQQQFQQLQQQYSTQPINPAQQGSLTEDTLRQLLENSSSTEKRKLLKNLKQQSILSQQPPVRLPKLEANQQLAIIEGQICIINDDLSTSSPSPTVQDIAGQQVIVQPMITTQPSSAGAEEQPAVNPLLPSLQHWQNPTTTSYPSQLTQILTTAYGLQTVEASSGINLMSHQQQTPPPSVADATRQTQQSQAATYQSPMYQLAQQQLAATGHQQQTMNAARQEPVFWRSIIPSTPCNLEDDDIEIDAGYTGAGQATMGKKMKSSDDNDKLYFDDELQVDIEVEVVGAGTYDRGIVDIDQTEDDVIVILAEEEKENSHGFNT